MTDLVVAFGLLHLCLYCCVSVPLVLWRCWLGGRKGIRPVKSEWWVAGMVICLERGADLHMVQLMLLVLTVSCFSKIEIGFTFLVPAHPGSPGRGAVKWVCAVFLCCYRFSVNKDLHSCHKQLKVKKIWSVWKPVNSIIIIGQRL